MRPWWHSLRGTLARACARVNGAAGCRHANPDRPGRRRSPPAAPPAAPWSSSASPASPTRRARARASSSPCSRRGAGAGGRDRRAAAARPRAGPFAGIPISVKDLFDVAGEVTAAGSVVLADAPPARAHAPVIARMLAAGFVPVGRTNMTEFAFSGLGLNPHHGTPASPWDRATRRIPGGSSSGAAVSVADGMAFAALGTDTGGSCRVPAALCGVVGYKPTARRVPIAGRAAAVVQPGLGGPAGQQRGLLRHRGRGAGRRAAAAPPARAAGRGAAGAAGPHRDGRHGRADRRRVRPRAGPLSAAGAVDRARALPGAGPRSAPPPPAPASPPARRMRGTARCWRAAPTATTAGARADRGRRGGERGGLPGRAGRAGARSARRWTRRPRRSTRW